MKKFTILFAAALILLSNLTTANDKILPVILEGRESGYQGMEFWFSIPPLSSDYSYAPYLTTLHFFSSEKTTVNIEVIKTGFSNIIILNPNVVYNYDLYPEVAFPFFKLGKDPIPNDTVYKQAGIHIISNKPITIFVNANNNNEGFVPMPVLRLGKEYICSTYNNDPYFQTIGQNIPVMTCITATEDNTQVTFKMGGNTMCKTTRGLGPGDVGLYKLDKGDVLSINSGGYYGDLAGSIITASKPVSVISGNQVNNIPDGNSVSNYCVESELPTELWGLNYHIPQINIRSYSQIIRIYAKEANTNIYSDNKLIFNIKSAGGIWGEGYVETQVAPVNQSTGPVVISGDKPIKVMFYNCGNLDNPKADSILLPFWMSLIPDDLFQTEAMFYSPGKGFIMLIYQTQSDGLMPQDFILGTYQPNGNLNWEIIAQKYPTPDRKYNFNIDKKHYSIKTISLPDSGLYTIKGSQPFGVYSYGFSRGKAYGYPAGFSLPIIKDTNVREDFEPPEIHFTLECDGSVSDGKATDLPDIWNIRSNLEAAIPQKDKSYNYNFEHSAIESGRTESIDWRLDVVDKSKNAHAELYFKDKRNNISETVIDYKAKSFLTCLENRNSNYIKQGKTEQIKLVIKNIGNSIINDLFISLKNGKSGFTLSPLNDSIKISINDTFRINIQFISNKIGIHEDTVVIYDSCRIYENVPISYFVYAGSDSTIIPEATPAFIDFGKVLPDNIAQRQLKLYNPNSQLISVISNIEFKSKQNYFYTSAKPQLEIFPLENQVFTINFKSGKTGIYFDTLCLGNSITYSCPVAVRAEATTILNIEGEEFNQTENYFISGINIIPQPMSGMGKISFSISKPLTLTIRLTDLFGCTIINILNNASLEAGHQEIRFEAEKLAPGIYFLEIICEGNRIVRKIAVVK